MKQANGIRRLIIGLVAMVSLVVAQGAGAGSSTTCGPDDEVTFDESAPGTSLRVAAAYRASTGPTFHQIGFRSKGTDASGDPAGGAGTCGSEDRWDKLTILLGGRPDRARLDNRKPRFNADFGPVPNFVDVTIDGGRGDDLLRGHGGRNKLNGQGGGDTLIGFEGRDVLRGGKAKDVLKALDNQRDEVLCGAGNDKAIVDMADEVSGCEDVSVLVS